MKIPALLVLFCFSLLSQAQVPSYGTSKTIDMASWNLYWYGHPSYGSKNNVKQRAGIGEVIRNSRIEIWFFQEIVDSADLSQVLDESGSYGHVYSNYWQDQKMGIAWEEGKWTLQSDSQLFKNNAASFANGRFPLFVELVAKDFRDTLLLVGIHLKAHTGTEKQKLDSYLNRRASVQLLNQWQGNHIGRKVLIAGDWNDDIDQSNYHDTISPFHQVMDESGSFLFEKESYAGQHSWYYGTSMIDHIWANSAMHAVFKPNSQKILPLDWYLDAYATEVSDHFPVFAAFIPSTTTGLIEGNVGIILYPNPCYGFAQLSGLLPDDALFIYTMQGEQVTGKFKVEGENAWISGLHSGFYLLRIRRGEQDFHYRLLVNP